MKTSLVFLGSVAAATYAAHKFWPKGITYGEKEEWEIEKAVKKEKAKKSAEWDDSDRSDGPSRRGDSRSGVSDRRRDYDYDRPRSTQGRLGIQDVPRLHGDGPTPEVDRIVYATRPLRADRAQADGVTSMSVASGSRTGDVRRAQYVEDSRTIRPERSYAAVRERTDDDYRPAPRYVEYEARRYSLEEPSDPRRGERIVYARRDDGYR